MNKSILVLAAFLIGVPGAAAAQGSKWGGNEPAPTTKGQVTPPQVRTLGGCFGSRTKGGGVWQIACYQSTAACEQTKAEYARTHQNTEAIGCSTSMSCFTYNNGATGACYVDGTACSTARTKMLTGGGNIGPCTQYTSNAQVGHVPVSTQPTPNSCFAFTISTGRLQVSCWYADECPGKSNQFRTSITLACQPGPFHCFSYNRGAAGVCYATKNECDAANADLSRRSPPGSVGPCKENAGGVVY